MLSSVLIFSISAIFLGLGMGRFAFSPVIPELIAFEWLTIAESQALGAANLVGYLAGALLAKPALWLTSSHFLCSVAAAIVVMSYALFILPLASAGFGCCGFSPVSAVRYLCSLRLWRRAVA